MVVEDVIASDDPQLQAFGRILVVVAHPDDLESHCAGTVALLIRTGSQATLAVVTSGDKGSSEIAASPAEVAAQREAEQFAAAELLGIEEVVFLRWPDGELDDLRSLRREITRQVRAHRPDLVITHDGEHPWPAYTAHRDHRAVGRATLEALYPDARDPLYYPEQWAEGLAPHETSEAWLIMSTVPDLIVDISPTMSANRGPACPREPVQGWGRARATVPCASSRDRCAARCPLRRSVQAHPVQLRGIVQREASWEKPQSTWSAWNSA